MINSLSKGRLFIFCFLIAFLIRLILIYFTIGQNENIDLTIYRDSGQLVANGVNPYNFNDNIIIRDSLRLDAIAFNAYTSENQARWDYFANSNLPLASLFFGTIEFLFQSSFSYRVVFAFFDSLLSVLILAFLIDFWKIDFGNNRLINKELKVFNFSFRVNYKLVCGLCLGAFNPILLLNGTVIPEHKGTGIFFILAAIYFVLKSDNKYLLFVSAVSLGFSVAFIGLGAFLAPFCYYNIYKKQSTKLLVTYFLLSIFSCLIWLIPFMPELYTMMEGRILTSGQTGLAIPINSTFWVIFYKIFAENWIVFKQIFMALFAGLCIFGFVKKRINTTILSAAFLYFFVNIFLIEGSMDRMNIGLLITILLLGCAGQAKITMILSSIYIVYGLITLAGKHYLGLIEVYDGYFNLLFTLLFTGFLFKKSFENSDTIPVI